MVNIPVLFSYYGYILVLTVLILSALAGTRPFCITSLHSRTNEVRVVFVVLTLTHNTMQSVVAGQAPITLEWKKYLE